MDENPHRAVVETDDDDVPLLRIRDYRRASAPEREHHLESLAARLDLPMTLLGIVFLLLVLAQNLATAPPLRTALETAGWLLWAVFVAEFALRLYLAPARLRFLRRHWWQVVFLVLPMLRFLRLLFVLRLARAGRVVSSAVRSSRSAGRVLSSRLGQLLAVTAIVVLAASQLLYAFNAYDNYGEALYATALTTVVGEPSRVDHPVARAMDVLLGCYSVAVFAGLAGALGAYFIEGRHPSAPGRPAGSRRLTRDGTGRNRHTI